MSGLLHLVLARKKPDVASTAFDAALDQVRKLRSLEGVHELTVGPDISVEGLAAGYTHAIYVRFADSESRDAYLRHPEHVRAGELLGACVSDLVVVDVVADDAPTHP